MALDRDYVLIGGVTENGLQMAAGERAGKEAAWQLRGGWGWQLTGEPSKGHSPLATPLGPAGHTLKPVVAPLVRVGNVQPLPRQKHLHLHALVQLDQLICRLQAQQHSQVCPHHACSCRP